MHEAGFGGVRGVGGGLGSALESLAGESLGGGMGLERRSRWGGDGKGWQLLQRPTDW